MKKRKKIIIATGAVLALSLIAGTFAYWSQTASIKNPFDTGKKGMTVIENFKPDEGDDWQPGSEVDKDVFVQNTGDSDLIVRVKLDESWTRKGETDPYKIVNSETDGDVYTVSQDNPLDGLTNKDMSVVVKHFNSSASEWIDGGDGWYYYAINLEKDQTTEKWLDSVELAGDTDLGLLETVHSISVTEGDDATTWVWVTYNPEDYEGGMPKFYNPTEQTFHMTKGDGRLPVLHNKAETRYVIDSDSSEELVGYSDSDYVLTVTAQTVQATKEAIDEVFGAGNTFDIPTGCTWTLVEE